MQLSAPEHNALGAGLSAVPHPSLRSLEISIRGTPQETEHAPAQQASNARPVSAEGGSGRCQRQAGAGALFQEIASRLPLAGGGAAGYTDVYDFPEGALEVADGFLRDAPASEQPGSNAAAEAAATAQAHTAVPLAAAGRGLSQQGVGLERQPPGALQPDCTDLQHEAASHSAAPAAAAPAPVTAVQETEQRSCRSSVTPHKAGMRDADAGGDQHGVDSRSNNKASKLGSASRPAAMLADAATDSNSSQAAHESQAGVSLPVKSWLEAAAQHEQDGLDGRKQQQRPLSSPSLGLDMLAAAASRVGAVPGNRVAAASASPTARGGAALPAKKQKVPNVPNGVGAPGRKQRAGTADTAAAPATPSKGQPKDATAARPKTPGRARPSPAKATSPGLGRKHDARSSPLQKAVKKQRLMSELCHSSEPACKADEQTPNRRVANAGDADSTMKAGEAARNLSLCNVCAGRSLCTADLVVHEGM